MEPMRPAAALPPLAQLEPGTAAPGSPSHTGAQTPPGPDGTQPLPQWGYCTASRVARVAEIAENSTAGGDDPCAAGVRGTAAICEFCGSPFVPKVARSHRRTCTDVCADRLRQRLIGATGATSKHDAVLVARFRVMWERGDSCRVMAAAFRVSVNTIAGLRQRIPGLKARGNPVKRKGAAALAGLLLADAAGRAAPTQPSKPIRRASPRVFAPKKIRVQPDPPPSPAARAATDAAAGPTGGVAPLELARHQCNFPITAGRPWRFCGGPAAGSGCYCATHTALALGKRAA